MAYFLELEGTARDRGRAHGEALKEPIREAYKELAKPRPLVPSVQRRMQGYADEHWPDTTEEWSGIAEGCGLNFEQVFHLGAYASASIRPMDSGCTSFAIRGIDGSGLALGKTSDINDDLARYYLVRKIHVTDAQSILTVGIVGTLWVEVGLNSAGVACGANSGPRYFQRQDGTGLAQHVFPYPLLPNVKTAEDLVAASRNVVLCGKGINAIIADRSGVAINLEKSFDYHAERRTPGRRLIGATNIFLNITEHSSYPTSPANSARRLMNLSRWGEQPPTGDPVAEAKEILADRTSEGAICQSGQEDMVTFFTYVVDPIRLNLHMKQCAGDTKEKDYRVYTLR